MKRKINISFIIKKHTLVIFCVLFAFFANLRISYSQNVLPEPFYCNSDPPTLFRITNPGGKTWTCDVPGVIANIFNGEAIFSPALVPGPYPRVITILYQNPNYVGEPAAPFNPALQFFTYLVTITTPPIVTFAPVADVCVNDPIFPLPPRGNPATGIYAGPGVDAGGFFHPAVAGAGTHSISYTYPTTGCSSTAYQMVTVRDLPPVSLAPFSNICINAAPITLTTGAPGGGTYTGTGVAAGMFNPGAAGVGTHTITYTFSDGLCTNSASRTITVNALPSVTIGGLFAQQCDTDPPYTITGFPTGASGTFNGNGITDNNNGTAVFNPGNSGLGLHNIIYSYTDANGCSNSNIQITRVGTELFMYGLTSNYCANEPVKSFTYTPANSANPLNRVSGTGIIDNMDGTATFNPGIAAIGNNTITYTFWDDIGCENIITQNVFVADAPVADFSGLNASLKYCFGSIDVTLTGNHPGGSFTGPVGCIVDNGDGTAIFRPSVLTEGIYSIIYSYTNSSGCTDTETKNIEILPLPTIFNVTGGGAYCNGTAGIAVGLSSSTSGVNYQLFRDGFAVVPNNIQAGDGNPVNFGNQTISGAYTVVATNAVTTCSRQMNGSVSVSVTAQATITAQPVDDTVCETGSAVFLITASGQNLTYAWTKNGAPVVGANSNILALNNMGLVDNGHLIVCTVTSTCPVGFSNSSPPVTLTVNPNTTIITHPSGIVKCTGTSHTFSVAATGVNNTYLWKRGATDILETPGKYINAGTANLTILNLTTSDAGNYTCYINGICGTEAQSNPANLQVIDPIVITTQPTSVNPCAGYNISFSTVATPAGLSYQWYFNNGGGATPVAGATNSNYSIIGVAPANEGTYYCSISSLCGAIANTNTVSLNIPDATIISGNPAGGTICAGGNYGLSVIATGSNLNYQWIKDGIPLVNNAIISGSNLANLTLTGATLAYSGNYWCNVIGDCGALTTPAATLFVEQAVTFISQPTNKTVCPNSDATFSVSVNGSNLTYEWQKNTVPIAGASNSNYTIVGATAADAGNYRCRIANACGNTFSNEVSLTVNTAPAILTQPVNVSSCENLNVSFSVVASGTSLTYQWYKNAALIGGATNSVLNLINITTADAASYSSIITGTCGTIPSASGTLSVDVAPIIATHPLSKTVCPGMATDLTVIVPAGTNLIYQWVKDGANVGANSPIYNIPSFAAGDVGSYHCNITNNCGTVTSNSATLTLGSPVNITSNPVSITACTGSIANFAIAAIGSNLSYQWLKDGFPLSNGGTISGVNTPTLTINGIVPGDDGNYRCLVTNSCNNQTSTSASLTVSQAATITQQPQSATGCIGEPLNIVTIASGTNLAYQWYRNGVPIGLNNPVYAIANFAAGDAGTYRCEITNGCGTVVSDNAVISLGVTTNITSHPVSAVRCIGSDVNFIVTANGSSLTYQWKKDGVNLVDNARITATNTNSLSITGVLISDLGTYTCDVIGSCETETSNGAVLSVKIPVTITSQPDNLTACNGSNAIFDVIATGDNLTYSWQKNGVAIIPAETSSSLVLVGVNNSHEGVYNCRVSNSCSFEISTSADLIVDDNLVINTQPLTATQCQGTNVSFTVNVTGPPNTVYQWLKDGIPVVNDARISGAGSSILNINTIVPADNGSYSCRLTSSCGFDESDIAVLTVLQNVTITVSPTSFSVLNGNSANFTVVAAGSITGYQWRKDGIDLTDGGNISGALTANLTIANTTAADQGAYTCYVTGSCNSIPSNPANLIVLASSSIIAQPVASVTVCEGGTLNLFITTSGAGHSYQWKKDGVNVINGGNISGATTSTLTISNLTSVNQGAYTCLVDGIESSSPSVVVINPSTIITVQPVDATKCVNDNVIFVVGANGTGLTYQWQKNLVNIGGATGTSYVINPLVDGDDGVYTCIVTGVCGIKTSNPATLVVNKNTVINTHPAGTTICEGTTTSLSIVADGDNLTYQWKKNGSTISDAGNISGTNTNTLGISNALPADAGIYSCTVSGACGNETSNFATLVVNPTTLITLQPIGRTKCEGDNVAFTVNSTGATLIYQWQKNNVNVINDGNITGATTANLNISSISQVAHQGTYTCIVSGTCGTSTSDPAVLTVSNITVITTQPLPAITICQSASTTISIVATGGNLTYQWTKNGIAVTNGGNISGATTNNLVISNALTSDAGFYNCTVTGTCGSETSSLADLRVNPTTIITVHPVGQTLCEGDNIQFMVVAVGAVPLTYQWRKDNVVIPLATSNTLTLNNIAIINAGAYTCVVTGTCGVATSNPANLIINPAINITVQPVNTTICQDNVAIISLIANGTNLSYKWKYNGAYISDNGRITGAITNELRIALAKNSDEGIYKCEIFSACGSKESNSVVLTVTDSTKLTSHPVSQTLLQGSTASFNVSATGAGLTYQWQKDNVDIFGATSSSLSIVNVQPSDAGSYRCIVSGACGQIISNLGILTVNQLVSITSQPASLIRCAGQTASFAVVATGTIVSYQWKFNGSDIVDGGGISGAKTANLVISPVNISHAGNYTCIVTGSTNIANSNVVNLTVNVLVSITLHPLSQTKCNGDILVLEVAPNDPALTYSWEFNGNPLSNGGRISGVNTSKLVITNVSNADAGSYRCSLSNICTSATSNPATVTIDPVFSITTNPSNLSQCEGQTAFFSVTTNISTVNYKWYLNGAPLSNTSRISGVNTANLIINNVVLADQGSYSCLISDNCSSANSASAVLTVKKVMVINVQPSDKTVCEGEDSFLEVNATGDNLVYQWQKNGVNLTDAGNIFGSGSSILIIQNTTISDQGVYRCSITSGCNGILTNTANLAVNALPGAAGAISGDNVICQGDKNVLYVVPAISNATSYVWDIPYGATIVSGNGTRSIQVDFSTISLSGVVSVHGVNGCGNGTESPFLTVSVNSIPVANAGSDQILCTNTATFNANVTAFGTWTKLSGLASIVNPNLSNSAVTNLGQGSNLFIWTVSENGCVARDSVVITNKQVFADAGTDQTICSLSTKLNANAPVVGTGNWSVISGGGLFSSVNDPKANIINLIRGTTVLRWSINNGGCISYDEMTIVNDLPSNSNAGLDTIILVNNYTLNGNNPAIGTGFWTLLSGSATITNPSQYNTTVTNLGIGVNTFQWTITKNLCYNQDAVKVINYTPTLTDAGPSQTLCIDRTSLMGTMPNYGTGQWSVIAGSGTFTDPYKFDTEVINIGKGQNIYRWTVYEYEITFDDVIITNNSPSTANAGIDQKLCDVNAILAGNNPFIGTGIWTLTGGSGTITNPGIYNSVVSNLGYGSNTFRWTIAFNGCSSYDEVVITNNKPTDADAGVDQITCADSVNLYPNTPTIGAGEWSVVQGSAFFTGNKAYNLARNNNLLKWTISNNGCFDSDTVLIKSNKPTTSFTGADKFICVDSINLPGNTPAYGTGVWTMLNGSASFADVTDPKSKVTNLASGQNRFRWTITYNGCASYSEVDITYNYIQSDAGGDQILCQANAILSANDPGVGMGQWSVVGGSGSANFLNPNQSTTEVIKLDKGINILRWTITNSTCISYDDVIITNNTPSTAYAGSDRSVCGEVIFLNANNPIIGNGVWIVLSGSANIQNPALYNSSVSNLSIGQNVLRWTVTNQNCTSSDEVVIKNDQPSNIEAGPDQYNCSASAQLYATAPAGGSGRWSISKGSATFQDNTLYNSLVTNLDKGQNILVWTVTISGCSNSDTVKITNNLPSTPGAGPDQDLCADNAFMAANQPLIGTGRWSVVSGSAVFENLALPNTKTSNLGNGPNILRWTTTNGSCVLYDEVTITNSLPTVAYAGEDRAVCNTSANLLSAAPISGTGSWSVVSGYGIFIDPKKFDTQITTLGFGPNTLRWTTENGRCRTSDDVIITNNLAEAYAGPDQLVYASDVRLVGNKPASGTGQWVILAGRGTIANPSNFETGVSGLGGGANTFSWTINNGGCIASDDVVITNKILPVTDFDPLPGKGCAPLTVSFVNNSIGGAPFHWDFGDGVKSDATNTSHTYNVPGNYLVRLSSTGPDGIILHKDSIVVVYAIPVAQFKVTPDTAYIPGNSINFFNLTQDIDSLRWEFGDGNFSKEMNPSYKYNAVGSYDVTLHVWSGFQCYDSVLIPNTVVIELAGIIKCPNAFTPNPSGPTGGNYNQNDFSNDVFHCFVEGVVDYHLEIYNRMGIILFKSDDINVGWDGYFKGKLVEEGAYVFKVYGRFNNGERFNHVGNIVLLH